MSTSLRLHSEITLIRHGQAQTGAVDEISYDQLSDLGVQQAAWLGAYLNDTHTNYKHILCGSLNRQRDTAEVIG